MPSPADLLSHLALATVAGLSSTAIAAAPMSDPIALSGIHFAALDGASTVSLIKTDAQNAFIRVAGGDTAVRIVPEIA